MTKILFISFLTLLSGIVFGQESDDFLYMNAFIVIADTSESYNELHGVMFDLHENLNFEIDTLDRGFDKNKNIICLPEDHEDDLYAGSYFPRRYPSDKLSLEYFDYYKKGKRQGKIIALVVSISDKKEHAESILKKVKTVEKNSFILETKIYMGCMH